MFLPLKDAKQALRDFMRQNYTDERLIMLLDHARAGKLAYHSCCCFVGISNAHFYELCGETQVYMPHFPQYGAAKYLPGASRAEDAFNSIGIRNGVSEERRRRILIPMILAELKRRQRANIPQLLEFDSMKEKR